MSAKTGFMLPGAINIHRNYYPIYVLMLVSILFGWSLNAFAAESELPDGAGVVTTFSGLRENRGGEATVDPRGISVRALDLSRPGVKADGSLVTVPELFSIEARDVGQVFAVALDDEEPANVYVAASSAYGLFRTSDNSEWARGMWGDGGGPGTIYKLDASNGYEPVIFARVALNGRFNSGAGLGDISYDAVHQQLFVSDLETGMIHRFDVRSGDELGVYDHGVDGRTRFRDAETGRRMGLDGVSFNIRGEANVNRCGQGRSSAAAARFMASPECWNFAPFKRRVWAVSFRQSGSDGGRLYYSVWGSSAFGESTWDVASEDANNSIWSVGINADGSFDATDVRREFVVPPFYVSRQDRADYGNSQPVASIEFLDSRVMLIAERGMPLGRQESLSEPALVTGAGRVMRFVRGGDGKWLGEGRYDIGSSERENDDPPHIRAGSSGGIGIGYGYNGRGIIDHNSLSETLWVSATVLCNAQNPCGGGDGDTSIIHGLQGLPTAMISDMSPVDAFVPYAGNGPTSSDTTPKSSYFIGFGDTNDGLLAGDIGDVVFAQIPGSGDSGQSGSPPPPTGGPVASGPFDLAVTKSGPAECLPEQPCVFNIDVTNRGRSDYAGPVFLSDIVDGGLSLISSRPNAWQCGQNGGYVSCNQQNVTLASGQSLSVRLDFSVPDNISRNRVNNCAEIAWLGRPGREQVRAVQTELNRRGFNPGIADGVPGRNTASAIRAAEAAYGLPRSGEITDELLLELFDAAALLRGDVNSQNDRECAAVEVDIPEPVHDARMSAFHRSYRSGFHDQATSGPVEVHDPAVSNFHLRFRSSMHDGRVTRPVPVHNNRVSGFHQGYDSEFHERGTSRHVTGLSRFHAHNRSNLHNPGTSDGTPLHHPRLSRFHGIYGSRFHSTINSEHRTGLSQFHSQFQSGTHN
ncbi:MAG: peptidoglycan-binding protein, partial [Fimbriimonadaceae bacterium]|nr:peptidoglycan-binding protein [Alphaproteobacteria bacterium]